MLQKTMGGDKPRPYILLLLLCGAVVFGCGDGRDRRQSRHEQLNAVKAPRTQEVEVRSKYNLLIILVDKLRADHLASYGYGRVTSPIIDGLAAGGVRFHNVITQAPWTWPATVSLFTGLYPESHGCTVKGARLDDRVVTLAEILKKNGYRTAAFVANPYLVAAQNLSQGFDQYDDGFVGQDGGPWWGERMLVQNIHSKVFPWIDEVDKTVPYFLYLHYIDVHGPYIKPTPFPDDGKSGEENINIYDGAILHTDKHIGQLLERLRGLGILDSTLVVVTSDHGAQHGEYGITGHGFHAYDEQLRVPLIFYNERLFPEPRVVDQQVRLIDVMPTIMNILGVGAVPEPIAGLSLTPFLDKNGSSKPSRISFSSSEFMGRSLDAVRVDNSWKLVDIKKDRRRPGTESLSLFDLGSPAPSEAKNHLGDKPEKAAELMELLKEHRRNTNQLYERTTIDLDENLKSALKALGYVNK